MRGVRGICAVVCGTFGGMWNICAECPVLQLLQCAHYGVATHKLHFAYVLYLSMIVIFCGLAVCVTICYHIFI